MSLTGPASTPPLDARYPTHLREAIDAYLERLTFSRDPATAGLEAAMRYTLVAGGKRVRPVLVLAAARAVGMREASVLPLAAAVELVHSLSLIHDDLPAMDDADERRGRPANHRLHGEAVAILAGDAMFAEAFHLMLTHLDAPAERVRRAAAVVAAAAGTEGMAGGQYLDLVGDGDDVIRCARLKTGALIAAGIGAVLELAPDVDHALAGPLRAFGDELGLMFQLVDDILDGDGDVRRAEALADECLARIEQLLAAAPCDTTELLAIATFVRHRTA